MTESPGSQQPSGTSKLNCVPFNKYSEVSCSVPVKVPPGKKIIVDSTVKRCQAVVPFTYTVVWYSGSKENIIKKVTLPGVYEGVHVEDLNHEYKEVPLE